MGPVVAGMSGEGAGTGGAESVTSRVTKDLGGLPLRWAVVAVAISLIQLADVISGLQTARRLGEDLPVWRALADGYSSAGMIILLYPALRRLARATPPWDGRLLRLAVLQAAGWAVYFAAYLLGFSLIRLAAYAAWGEVYRPNWGPAALATAPSALIAYSLITAVVWGALWLERRTAALAAAAAPASAVFDIRDGTRTIHAPVDDILAVCSAGNYVEFHLADGRKPLMRATLAQVEAELSRHGLARTHRSWLVNTRAIAETRRVGAGDFELTLAGGLTAPLSRRWRHAVEAARGD
jgi:hypothetical protein